ncbi:DUF2946 family protein [Maritimibacter sp. DP1N21-5]|uniref:DUF2946 family protein n=1 Tax=Maritimibacter sp. DP1N21-5 TaxID=2836867 RepID=UPI001C451C64|nr:DUF2946 family protein [Maritimibacter sp. DP1N21-5]MBV7408338.1 hypothetical protein [Maritimibacter sp. DP1N21-5]
MSRRAAMPLFLTRWIVAFALTISALLPASVMTTRDAAGEWTVVICTGDGPLELAVDPATGAPIGPASDIPGEDGASQKGALCHLNDLRSALVAFDLPGVRLAATLAQAAPEPVALPLPPRAPRFDRPIPRAPPLTA